jgi:predicted DNA binding protein
MTTLADTLRIEDVRFTTAVEIARRHEEGADLSDAEMEELGAAFKYFEGGHLRLLKETAGLK